MVEKRSKANGSSFARHFATLATGLVYATLREHIRLVLFIAPTANRSPIETHNRAFPNPPAIGDLLGFDGL